MKILTFFLIVQVLTATQSKISFIEKISENNTFVFDSLQIN